MKRKIIFLLCLTFIFSVFCTQFHAAVDDSTVQPRFTFIQSVSVSLNINSSGTANYSATMTANSSTVSSTKITMVLQCRKVGTTNWTAVKTTSGTGSSYCSVSSSMAATKGYDYRVKATCTANGSYAETTIKYSSVKTYN